ncbi:histidine kinase [Neisseria oralis]|uniref:Sensor protein n=1 Tax=Neisseria oralis TaxID=1107316 RepID=A0ABW8Q561_9NEIS
MKPLSFFSDGLSLSARLKLLTLLWVGSALLSVVFTLLLSWRLEGASTAINDAGSLRMQTYRLAYMVGNHATERQINNQIKEFEQSLQKVSRTDAINPLLPAQRPQAYDLIQSMLVIDWQSNILPKLQKHTLPTNIDLYRFAGNIDLFVQALENANEENTRWLRRFQMALILMILIAAGVMIKFHYSWIIRPLEALLDGVQTIGRGGFGVAIPTGYIQEFAQVSKGFNQMSAHLKTLYTDLEGLVARQTQDLARQNRDLEMLYQTTRDLHQTHTPTKAAEEFLSRVVPAVSASAGSIRLLDFERKRTDLVASTGLPADVQTAEQCSELEACLCGHKDKGGEGGRPSENPSGQSACFYDARDYGNLPFVTGHPGFARVSVFPILYKSEELGILTLYFSDGIELGENDDSLLRTLCGQLGVSIANSRFAQERSQLAVLQERNLIAQGLHDSIAQTLTFLNLQVQMLDSAYKAGEKEQMEENIRFLTDGVQECYDDVRELLLNFRTKISNKDFPEAVTSLLARFEQQTQIEVDTAWRDDGPSLNNDEQLQVIFILQESLSNIRKHAQAHHVVVELDNRHDFTLRIRDDGVGFDTGRLKNMSEAHVGLGIMQERARRINAVLSVESQPHQGTTVTLVLPQHRRTAS